MVDIVSGSFCLLQTMRNFFSQHYLAIKSCKNNLCIYQNINRPSYPQSTSHQNWIHFRHDITLNIMFEHFIGLHLLKAKSNLTNINIKNVENIKPGYNLLI